MINFILCEDDIDFRKNLKQQIENFMMNSDTDYKIYEYDCYDEEFLKIIDDDIGFKAYFLDIKTDHGSGIDAARYIREEKDDWNSLLIIVTAFSEYRFEALSNRLFLLDFISKLDDCKNKVLEVLKIVMKNYDNRKKCLSYEYNYTMYKIDYKNIIYIEKEQDSKRCIIYTNYKLFKAPMTLTEMEKKLDKRFLKVHRSLIVNLERIHSYNVVENTITFDNGFTTNLVARGKRKELIESVAAISH